MTHLRAPERLTRSGSGEMDLARAHLVALAHAAGALVLAAVHDPDRADCAEAGCRLAAVDEGPGWCRLAHRLALLDGDTGGVASHGQARDLEDLLAAFRTALVGSLDAVRACRSIAHAEGHCWFATMGVDGCSDVLRAAHRVG